MFWISCQVAHVQHDAALAERLPAHAVAHAGGGDRELVVARKSQCSCDVIDAAYLNYAVDLGLVEATCIIDAAAELRPFHVLQRRNRLDPFQVDLNVDLGLLAAANRRSAILFAGRIGGQRLKFAVPVNAKQHHDHRGDRRPGFELL